MTHPIVCLKSFLFNLSAVDFSYLPGISQRWHLQMIVHTRCLPTSRLFLQPTSLLTYPPTYLPAYLPTNQPTYLPTHTYLHSYLPTYIPTRCLYLKPTNHPTYLPYTLLPTLYLLTNQPTYLLPTYLPNFNLPTYLPTFYLPTNLLTYVLTYILTYLLTYLLNLPSYLWEESLLITISFWAKTSNYLLIRHVLTAAVGCPTIDMKFRRAKCI